MTYLSKLELFICFSIYLLFLLYGVWNVYFIRNKIISNAKHDFDKGWTIINRPKDDSDDELETFKIYLWRNLFWFIGHVVLSEIVRLKNEKYVPIMHAIIGFNYILFTQNTQSQLLILCLLCSFYIGSKINSKIFTWFLICIWISVINFFLRKSTYMSDMTTYEQTYELIMILSWGILKCSSFNLSYINSQNNNTNLDCYNGVNYFGYNLYFPTFIFGPFMIFERYIKVIDVSKGIENNIEKRLIELMKDLSRIIFWTIFIDFISHFIYVHYLEQDLKIVQLLNSFGLYGFGYLMGQFFHLHYTITYGLGIAIAKFEQLNPPCRPKCIARIHFYSDMWKFFDQGLYEFLLIHIYIALCSKTSSLLKRSLSSVATFTFIFIWHGCVEFIFMWTLLNFICLSLEKYFKHLTSSRTYKNFVEKNLSIRNQKRLYGFLGVHIFIPSAISNFYFFAGLDIGNYFMITTYTNGILKYLSLTTVCYCIFQCSQTVTEWEKLRIS